MRLDKYLKVSRLIKRRTVANEACDNERVSVNGRPAKASYDVKVGDVIELRFGARTVRVEVLQVADNVRKDDASAMYREVGKRRPPHPVAGIFICFGQGGMLHAAALRCHFGGANSASSSAVWASSR